MLPIDSFEQHILSVLVGDMADHDSGSKVLAMQNTIQVYQELRIVVTSLFGLHVARVGRLLLLSIS